MEFLLNKRINGGRIASNDSTDTTVRHDFFEDSGIATSNDVHSLVFDDQLPVTPPPTTVGREKVIRSNAIGESGKTKKTIEGKIGTFEKSKATSSIPSLSINSNATINIHYYPEQSIFWSYVIVFISTTVQILIHGLHLSYGIFLLNAKVFFKNDQQDLANYGE